MDGAGAGRGGFGIWTLLASGVFTAAAGGLFMYIAGDKPRLEHVEHRVAAMDALDLGRLEQRLRTDGAPTESSLASLRTVTSERLDTLESRLQALEGRPPPAPAAPVESVSAEDWARLLGDLERMRTELGTLTDQIPAWSRLEARLSEQPWRAEMAKLRTELGALVPSEEALARAMSAVPTKADCDALSSRLQALEQRVAQVAASAGRAAPATGPVPHGVPPPSIVSERKGGLRMDIVSLRADSTTLRVDFLLMSEESDVVVSIRDPAQNQNRAILASGEVLDDGDIVVGNDAGMYHSFRLIAGVPVRFALVFEGRLQPPVTCRALIVGVEREGRTVEFGFRELVAR